MQGLHIDGPLRDDLRSLPEHTGRALKQLVTPLLDPVGVHVEFLRQLDQGLLAPDRCYRHSIVGKTNRRAFDPPDQMLVLLMPGLLSDPPHTWTAVANAGISGSDIRDIMLEAVERRFNACRALSVVEMLTDNGSPYIAKETQIFARQIGLKPCFTPVRSP